MMSGSASSSSDEFEDALTTLPTTNQTTNLPTTVSIMSGNGGRETANGFDGEDGQGGAGGKGGFDGIPFTGLEEGLHGDLNAGVHGSTRAEFDAVRMGGNNFESNSSSSSSLPPRATTPTGSADGSGSDVDNNYFNDKDGMSNNDFGFGDDRTGRGRLSLDDIVVDGKSSDAPLSSPDNHDTGKNSSSDNNIEDGDGGVEGGSDKFDESVGSKGSDDSVRKYQMINQDTGEVYDIR
eukprot:CAMPEP_0118655332 /NCGR_PEP_ID=MMETSP0785-20121206/12868_1 /TAXON_ID=91992 /ORGANISM="Bolidomonas pacifica, Strain CCMP 1866" /LENGTH=235 /DNA_ID=CAMNT_0006548055 /DNA_START=147 /DNA_END=851 /DNA_ORIENTATION=+